MTPEQLLALGMAFTAYLRLFEDCVARAPTVKHLHAYVRGLLSDLPRKSVEPIALLCGTAVRTLQEFLRDFAWDHERMLECLHQHLRGLPALAMADDLGTIGVIDETSVAKKGTKTPGVQRQYCGASGKVDNCVVTVHLALVRGLFKTLLDAALFLPQSWSHDRQRCREADIPDDVVYRPKWRLALEQVARACVHGLTLDWLTFDEYYGNKPQFLAELDAGGHRYMGEIPKNFRCLTRRPRGPKPPRGWKGKRVDNLLRHSSSWNRLDWQEATLTRLTLDKQMWKIRSGQVYLLRNRDVTERTYGLLVARNLDTHETKYFISNAPVATPLETLLRVAFSRWHVEHNFRLAKSEIGFSHFEGRSYVALMRHMTLCLIALAFAAEHTERLRGEKSGVDDRASVPGAERAVQPLAAKPTRHLRPRAHRRGHHVPSETKPSRTRVASETASAAP